MTAPDKPEDRPILVMRLNKSGNWQDLETVEKRDDLRAKREEMRQKAKDKL